MIAVELNGALSNHSGALEIVELGEVCRQILDRDPRSKEPTSVPARATIPISDLAEEVLRLAAEPMRVGDIHVACERLFGATVSYRSLRNCLSHGSRPTGRFVRLGYGLYRLRGRAER